MGNDTLMSVADEMFPPSVMPDSTGASSVLLLLASSKKSSSRVLELDVNVKIISVAPAATVTGIVYTPAPELGSRETVPNVAPVALTDEFVLLLLYVSVSSAGNVSAAGIGIVTVQVPLNINSGEVPPARIALII